MNKWVMTGVLAAMVCGSAQAATVYEKDGTKIDVKGDFQIQLRQKIGADEDPYFDYDDLTVGWYAKHKNEDGLTTFSHLKMDWKKQADGSAKAAVDEASIGIDYGMVKVHIGRIDWGSDDFYIDQSVEIGDDKIATPEVNGYETIQAIVDLGLAELVLSADLEVDDNYSVAEAYVVTNPDKFGGLELGVLFQSFDPDIVPAVEADAAAGIAGSPAVKPDTVDTVGVRAAYSIGKVGLGADFTTNDDKDVMNFAVKTKVTKAASIAAGYFLESPDGGEDVGTWYANVKQKLNKYTTVFAEVGDNDEDGSDLGYLAGMQVKF